MQHSVLDRIYIAFLSIMIFSFGVIIFIVMSLTKKSLLSERTDTLANEATLIGRQTVLQYVIGQYTVADMENDFKFFSQNLNAEIWFLDDKGQIIATSDSSIIAGHPRNIYLYDKSYNLGGRFSTSGNFYGLFNNDVVSINVPVLSTSRVEGDNTEHFEGALLIHAESSELNSMSNNLISIIFIPCLVMIVIAFILLAVVSKKIIQPVKRLNAVATEYESGNFEVKTGIKSKDEFGSLAYSLESMADGLSKLEQYRKDFISNISHDFRSPLTSIKGYIGAMQDGTIPPEKQDRYLKIVLDETDRLTKLTSGLLDLNNLERFGPYLKLSSFDVIELIKKTLNTFEIKSIEKKVAIYLNNHSEDTVVTADKEKIKQVVYNLIDNALKFTPENHKIFVTVMDREEKLVVSVRDEGIGMDEDTRKKVFVRFYKGDSSRGKDKKGTGLGLAITKEIVKAHNENIDVTSAIGQGTEFKFTLTKTSSIKGKDGDGAGNNSNISNIKNNSNIKNDSNITSTNTNNTNTNTTEDNSGTDSEVQN